MRVEATLAIRRALRVRTVACGELHDSLLMKTVCRTSGVYSECLRLSLCSYSSTLSRDTTEKRLCQAETQLAALTPPRGRGKRQITDEATLMEAMALVLKE